MFLSVVGGSTSGRKTSPLSTKTIRCTLLFSSCSSNLLFFNSSSSNLLFFSSCSSSSSTFQLLQLLFTTFQLLLASILFTERRLGEKSNVKHCFVSDSLRQYIESYTRQDFRTINLSSNKNKKAFQSTVQRYAVNNSCKSCSRQKLKSRRQELLKLKQFSMKKGINKIKILL